MTTKFWTWRSAGLGLALCVLAAATIARAGDQSAVQAGLIEVKLALNTITKTERATVWRRLNEYAEADAIQEFCGRKLNLQRRTWAAVQPCVEESSLRKVAAVFRTKKAEYVKNWQNAYSEPDKKKKLCETLRPQLLAAQKILDAHISEAETMCNLCFTC